MLSSFRRRREYLKLDFEQLLTDNGICSNLLMPRYQSGSDEHGTTPDNPESPYLPLDVSLLLLQLFVWHLGSLSPLCLSLWFTASSLINLSCAFLLDIWQWGVWLSNTWRLAFAGIYWRISWSETYSCKSPVAYRWQDFFWYKMPQEMSLCSQ